MLAGCPGFDVPQSGAQLGVEEEVLAKNDRAERLIRLIEIRRQGHECLADKRIISAIDDLILLIKSHKIAIADRNSSGVVWNQKSILQFIGDAFDPLLQEIIPKGSLAFSELTKGGTPLPLIDHLSKANLRRIADNLETAAQALEECFVPEIDDWDTMLMRGESLSVVAEIIDAVREALPPDPPRWCSACFRRARSSREYCIVHSPSHLVENDTSYRKAKRLRDVLPNNVGKAWGNYMIQRRALGESVELISNPEDVPDSFSIHARAFYVIPEVKNLVDKAQQSSWSTISAEWDNLLVSDFQHTSALLKHRPSELNNWNEFATHLLEVLDDRDEDSRHPFWILNILACAEEWIKAEQENQDGRATDTERKVVELFRNGVTDAKEIAVRVSKSKQYIYRILKSNGLRK